MSVVVPALVSLLVLPLSLYGQEQADPDTISATPAPVTRVVGTFDGAHILLTWELSVDDTVAAEPLADASGVSGYDIYLGDSLEGLELVATVPAGTTTYLVESPPSGLASVSFRIDAFDDASVAPGIVVDVTLILDRIAIGDAEGNPVYITVPDGATPHKQDFEDFLAFAAAFSSTPADLNWNALADTDCSGRVDFTDFLAFANAFGRTALDFGG